MISNVRAARLTTLMVLPCAVWLAFTRPAAAQIRASSPPSDWADLISFRPPAAIQNAIGERGARWHVHRIENARGAISLDTYPLRITRLPQKDGQRMTPAQFMTNMRLRFGALINPSMARFEAYDAAEQQRFISLHPLGSVMVIHIKGPLTGATVNSGAVVLSDVTPLRWRFSTVRTSGRRSDHPDIGSHFLSGSREWSLTSNGDGTYRFVTRAADRTTGPLDHLMHRLVFESADKFWLNFVSRVADDINQHGGEAHLDPALCSHQRFDWNSIQAAFQPTIPWVSSPSVDRATQRHRALWTVNAQYRLAKSRR